MAERKNLIVRLEIGGIAVHIGARVGALAGPNLAAVIPPDAATTPP